MDPGVGRRLRLWLLLKRILLLLPVPKRVTRACRRLWGRLHHCSYRMMRQGCRRGGVLVYHFLLFLLFLLWLCLWLWS